MKTLDYNSNRVFDMLSHSKHLRNRDDMFVNKIAGVWKKYSCDDVIQASNNLSKGLLSLGIKPNDKVAVMSNNCAEWNICDFGIMQIGAVQVPLYPTLSSADITYILNDAEVKIVFTRDQELYNKIASVKKEVPSLQEIYTFVEVDGLKNWKEVLLIGEEGVAIDIKPYSDAVKSEDILTLIYTSGTTGTPKGVMLTHKNLLSNVLTSSPIVPLGVERALSFLPISHIFERMIVYMYINLGISVYYAESMESIADNLKEISPQCFSTVPRLLEKVYDKILAKANELTGIKRFLFFWALGLGLEFENDGKNGWWYEFQLKIANKIIFNKWREALGGAVKVVVSGGAALQPRLAKVFWAAKIPVLEGYGLTETSPVISVNTLDFEGTKIGSVGKLIATSEIKIANDGEILFKGPNLMKGYYKKPEQTAEVIDQDGYFHTGDIGHLIDGIYLQITDRKKEMFKTAGGKYIAPQVLENKYKESRFIEQIMVIGENERFPAALVVPAFPFLKEWCVIHNLSCSSNEEIISHPEVKARIMKTIEKRNVDFGNWEQIKHIVLLPKEFSIEGGELTPKMSIKRKIVMQKYKDLVESIYRA